MARITNLTDFLTDVADAIRAKKGTEANIPAANFDSEIESIEVPEIQDSKTVTPSTSAQTVTPDEGYDAMAAVSVSAVTAAIDENIQAGNIKKNVTILGVDGTYEGTDTTDATAVAGDIREGKTAYANGEKLLGTLVESLTPEEYSRALELSYDILGIEPDE